MPVNVIGTLKPKNNGKFPVAEAVDIKVTDDLRLDEALENKADLTTLNFALAGKANATDLATSTANLQNQINQIEISASAESVVAPEVAAARVGADSTTYQTLKARLDAERNGVKGDISAIIDMIDMKSNMYNKDDTRNKSGGYYTSTGTYASATGYYVSHPIKVVSGIEYKATFPSLDLGNNPAVIYVNEEGTIQSYFNGTINDGIITFTPPHSGLISINLGLTSAKNAAVVARSDDYQEGLLYFSIQDLPDTIEDINISIDDINDQLDSFGSAFMSKDHVSSANLYNNADYVAGKYIQSDGAIISAAGYAYTGVIELEAGSYVTLCYYLSYGANSTNYYVCDSEGNIQSLKTMTLLEDSGNIRKATFTISEKTYIRLNAIEVSVSKLMVCAGDSLSDYPEEFVPYKNYDKVEENVHLSDTMKADVAQIAADNPLSGKMISAEGDSICYGNGYIGGYAKIIADENNMSYQNGAVGGGTIASGTYISGTETPRHWICRAINAMSSSADYIIIEGGVNDGSLQVPLGEITSGYNATLDDSTFYGALESIFKQVNMKFKEKKYCFLIPHQMTYSMTPKGNYYKAIYDCAEKWGMPICDLSKMVPPFGLFAANSDLREALTDVYTTAGDGWHPTEQCYRKYYVDKITSFLESL